MKVYLIIILYFLLKTGSTIRSDDYCQLKSSSYSCPNEYSFECIDYACSKNKISCDKYFMFKIYLNFDNFENLQMKHFQSRIIKCKIIKNNQFIKSDSSFDKMRLNEAVLFYLSIILINLLI
jgi:hypothetical protein